MIERILFKRGVVGRAADVYILLGKDEGNRFSIQIENDEEGQFARADGMSAAQVKEIARQMTEFVNHFSGRAPGKFEERQPAKRSFGGLPPY